MAFEKLNILDIQKTVSKFVILTLPKGGLDLTRPTSVKNPQRPKWAIDVKALSGCFYYEAGSPPQPVDMGTKLCWWADQADIQALIDAGAAVGSNVSAAKGYPPKIEGGRASGASPAAAAPRQGGRFEGTDMTTSRDTFGDFLDVQQRVFDMWMSHLALKYQLPGSAAAPYAQGLTNTALITYKDLGLPRWPQLSKEKEAAAEHNGSPGPPAGDDDSEDIPF